VRTAGSLTRARWLVLPACAVAFTVFGLAPIQADAAAVHIPATASALQLKQIPDEVAPGWFYTGRTWPVTAAGGHACEAAGVDWLKEYPSYTAYACRLDDPVNNRINLWVYGIGN